MTKARSANILLARIVLFTGLLILLQATHPIEPGFGLNSASNTYTASTSRQPELVATPLKPTNYLATTETVVEEKDDRRPPTKNIDSYAHYVGFQKRNAHFASAGPIKSTNAASLLGNTSLPLFLTTARIRL